MLKKKRLFEPMSECSVGHCSRKSRSRNAGLCEKHYYRMRRNGSTTLPLKSSIYPKVHSNGYVIERDKAHPLAMKDGIVYQHRRIYYDRYGSGPFVCHWCGIDITWGTATIDHLNHVKTDNTLDNLVVACNSCNINRERGRIVATYMKRHSKQIRAFGLTLPLPHWSRKTGIPKYVIDWRMRNGWGAEDAVSKPVGNTGPKSILHI